MIAGALVLTIIRDLHGPPMLVGAVLALVMLKWDGRAPGGERPA